jgi:diacylglycerol kinase family enzyme
VNESRYIPGKWVYPYSAVRTVPSWQPVAYEITVDGSLVHAHGYTVIVANSGYYGRGIHIAPDAKIDDGLLDVVIIDQIARRELPRFLMELRAGEHIHRPEVTWMTGLHVKIAADRPLPVYGDGDPVSSLPLDIDLKPGALRVLAPPA